jgi:outer membrane lipoprotein LolB
MGVTTDGDSLQVTDASGQAVDGDTARAALEQRLGTKLPLGELRYWMLGVPAPETQGPSQSATGPVPGFTQNGWVVSYEGFQDTGGWSLPNRVTATTGDARVRIVIDDWTVPTPTP